jgi:hypothetical protein
MRPDDVRRQLLEAGYCPIPLTGKKPVLDGWQGLREVTPDEIQWWSRTRPAATNTGVQTRLTPTLDIDILDEDAAAAVERLARERFEERGRILVRFGKRPKRAILFRTDAPFAKIAVNFVAADGAPGEKIEFLCDGQQVVVDGVHPDTGRPYEWFDGSLLETRRDHLPRIDAAEAQAFLDDSGKLLVAKFDYRLPSAGRARGNGADDGADDDGPTDWSFTGDDLIDHDRLAALAMRLVRSGMGAGACVNFLRANVEGLANVDHERRQRRLKEIPDMVSSAQAKIEEERRQPPPGVQQTPLDKVVGVFQEWLALKDANPVYGTLGAVAANLLAGDPVWLGLIAPPSSAKTELLNSVSILPYVEVVETFTPAALLSGTPRSQKAKGATGGVLRKIGAFGILQFKDFGSVLDLRHEHRADMMTALRRIYDGQYTGQIGAEGGKTLEWRGKAGCIFGATQKYDTHHAVSGTLGDRFLLFRVETMVEEQLTKCRLQAGDKAKEMREKLAKAVAGLFASLPNPLPEPEVMTKAEYASLSAVILKVIKLRAGVVRDGYRREIDDVHDPEGPARFSIALQQLFAGLILIGVLRATARAIVEQVAYDSTPRLRLRALGALTDDLQTTRRIAAKMKLPNVTARRALEDLHAQGLAELEEDDDDKSGGAHRWKRAS